MEIVEKAGTLLHATLKELIKTKSKRDRSEFTINQLARALEMPHSMLVRLMHSDPNKRVLNPRIDTLTKIVDFFKADGFAITIDDLLYGLKDNSIDINDQKINGFVIQKNIPVYSFSIDQEKLGSIDINLANQSTRAIAFQSDEDIKPMFKKGSIFVVDLEAPLQNDHLVAVKIDGFQKILIRKYYEIENKRILKAYGDNIKPVELTPTLKCQIIGVVIQVNAKT